MTAPTLLVSSGLGITYSPSGAASAFGGFGCGAGSSTGTTAATEAPQQMKIGTAGKLSNWYVSVNTNGRASSSTSFFVRQNGSSVMTATIAASTTGTITDTSSNPSLAQSDLMSSAVTTGTGTGSITANVCGVTFTATSGTSTFFQQGLFGAYGSQASTTLFCAFVGNGSGGGTTTEANFQTLVQVAGTAKYMSVYCNNNARTNTTTLNFRKNGGNGNQTLSYTSAQTGLKTDTSNTDSVSVNDLICMSVVLGTGTQGFTINNVGFTFDSGTDGSSFVAAGQGGGLSFAAGTTFFPPVGGILSTGAGLSTEAACRGEMGLAGTFSELWCYVSVNGSSTAPSLKFRNGGSNKNQVVTITANTTGAYQDTSHSDAFLSTDLINLGLTNITTGAISISQISMLLATTVTSTLNDGWMPPTDVFTDIQRAVSF